MSSASSDELGAQRARHRPADDAAAPHVEHDRQIEKAGPGRHVRDVGDPQLVRAPRPRTARSTRSGAGRRRLVATVVVTNLAPADALQAGARASAARRACVPTRTPSAAARRACAAPRRCPASRVNRRICARSARRRPRRAATAAVAPRVVPAGGDAQHAAHAWDGMSAWCAAHELESLDGIESVSCANQAAAFFRISRSSRSCGSRAAAGAAPRAPAWSGHPPAARHRDRPASPSSGSTAPYGSNSRASSSGVRPCSNQLDDPPPELRWVRRSTSSASWTSLPPNNGVSTKPGQLHHPSRRAPRWRRIRIAIQLGRRTL